jgi:hypothetical protein
LNSFTFLKIYAVTSPSRYTDIQALHVVLLTDTRQTRMSLVTYYPFRYEIQGSSELEPLAELCSSFPSYVLSRSARRHHTVTHLYFYLKQSVNSELSYLSTQT